MKSSEDEDPFSNAQSVFKQAKSPTGKHLLEEAMKGANDLNSLVRKRKRTASATKPQAPQAIEEAAPAKQAKPDTE